MDMDLDFDQGNEDASQCPSNVKTTSSSFFSSCSLLSPLSFSKDHDHNRLETVLYILQSLQMDSEKTDKGKNEEGNGGKLENAGNSLSSTLLPNYSVDDTETRNKKDRSGYVNDNKNTDVNTDHGVSSTSNSTSSSSTSMSMSMSMSMSTSMSTSSENQTNHLKAYPLSPLPSIASSVSRSPMDILRLLNFLLGEGSGYQHLLDAAIDTLDRGPVRHFIAEPSGRELYLVAGGSIDHTNVTNNIHNFFSTSTNLTKNRLNLNTNTENNMPNHPYVTPDIYPLSYSHSQSDTHSNPNLNSHSHVRQNVAFEQNEQNEQHEQNGQKRYNGQNGGNGYGYYQKMKQVYLVLDHKYCSCRSFYEMQSYHSNKENREGERQREKEKEDKYQKEKFTGVNGGKEKVKRKDQDRKRNTLNYHNNFNSSENISSNINLCKHIFAVYLAPHLNRLITKTIADEDFYKYMTPC